MAVENATQHFFSWFYTYNTAKVVKIESRAVGILNRILQIGLFVLIIAWIFVHDKGYQYADKNGMASSTTKLKGVAYTNSSDERVGKRLWDASDLNLQAYGEGSLFITTNILVTKNQTLGECPEHKDNDTICHTDSDCLPNGMPYHLGHGISLGLCNNLTQTCMVKAWCPIEDDSPVSDQAVLEYVADFTVFIKNSVAFPYYNLAVSNIHEDIDGDYLHSCHYHPISDPHCPVFRVGDIVALAAVEHLDNDRSFDDIAVKGGVISIRVNWNCNLDSSVDECKPLYSFMRLDNSNANRISKGYNYRYANNYVEDGVRKRDLLKRYGVLLIIETEAVARAFHFTTCLLNIGSGVALLSIAGLVVDIFMLHIHKRRTVYRSFKIQSGKALKDGVQLESEKNDSNNSV